MIFFIIIAIFAHNTLTTSLDTAEIPIDYHQMLLNDIPIEDDTLLSFPRYEKLFFVRKMQYHAQKLVFSIFLKHNYFF